MRNNSVNLFRILGQWFRRCRLKDFLAGALACSVEQNLLCNLKEGIMGNIIVKLYEIWTSGSGEDVVKRKVYGRRTKTDHNTSP